jgi:nitrile hydratase accessory protein
MTHPQSFTDLLPKTVDEPVFNEPWQAQAFALTVTVNQGGLFTWDEWATCLSEEIAADKAAGGHNDGSNYYALWLATLERLVRDKGAASGDELATLKEAWKDNYLATPHGQPVPEPGA